MVFSPQHRPHCNNPIIFLRKARNNTYWLAMAIRDLWWGFNAVLNELRLVLSIEMKYDIQVQAFIILDTRLRSMSRLRFSASRKQRARWMLWVLLMELTSHFFKIWTLIGVEMRREKWELNLVLVVNRCQHQGPTLASYFKQVLYFGDTLAPPLYLVFHLDLIFPLLLCWMDRHNGPPRHSWVAYRCLQKFTGAYRWLQLNGEPHTVLETKY